MVVNGTREMLYKDGAMKRGIIILCVLTVVILILYGVCTHFKQLFPLCRVGDNRVQEKLSTFCPVLEDQRIVAIVLAQDVEEYVERNLRSLFDQTYAHMRIIYIDNSSTDRTYKRAQKWIERSGRSDCITLIKTEKSRPALEVLYDVIGSCDPREVVVYIDGRDWLAHENVFKHLNCAYANPDVWMTYSRFISHPNYREIEGIPLSPSIVQEKRLRKELQEGGMPFITFYAALFQEIKLQDLMYKGEFIKQCINLTLQLPLIEMGMEHALFIDEVSYVKNENNQFYDHILHLQEVASVQSYLRSHHVYSPLSTLKQRVHSPSLYHYKSDLIIFSEDNPLYLYTCLESLFAKVSNINEVYVLYRGNDQQFQRAYLNLQGEFRLVHFFNVQNYPESDFLSLLLKILSNRRYASPYVLIGGDNMIFEQYLDLHECIHALERAHADHFFLHVKEREDALFEAVNIAPMVVAWQLGDTEGEKQRYIPPLLCRKARFHSLDGVTNFSSFMSLCQGQLDSESVVLSFEEPKVVFLQCNEEISLAQKKEWSHKFIEGFKIDPAIFSCEVRGKVGEGEELGLSLIKRKKSHSKSTCKR